ncbi:MAG: STAS domain-containing protein [Burkholderiales bacterium]
MGFRTISAVDHGAAKIGLHGAFNLFSGAQFLKCSEDLLTTPNIHELEIDMHGVEQIDDAALDALLILREKAASLHRHIVLSGCRKPIRKFLEAANLQPLFETR